MACGLEILQPVLSPAHRLTQVPRQRGDRKLLAVKSDLLAEPAAGVGRNDRNLRLRQPQSCRKLGAQWMRYLSSDMEGQMLAAAIPDRETASRLDRQVSLPMLREGGFHDRVRHLHARPYLAFLERLVRGQIARQAFVDQRSRLPNGIGEIEHVRQDVIVDLDRLGRVFCQIAIDGDNADHRVALETDFVDRQCGDFGRLESFDRRRHPHRGSPLQHIATGDHGDHAGHRAGPIGRDRADAGVGVRRAHEVRVQGAWHGDVVDVAGLSGEQPVIFLAQQRPPDLPEFRSRRASHDWPFRIAAALRTAATMFW